MVCLGMFGSVAVRYGRRGQVWRVMVSLGMVWLGMAGVFWYVKFRQVGMGCVMAGGLWFVQDWIVGERKG